MKRATTRKGQHDVTARIPRSVRAKIEEAAAWRGMSVSNFLVEAGAKEAEHVIEKERLLQLTREDAQLVLSLLDAPPPPNAAMLNAVQAHKRLIRG